MYLIARRLAFAGYSALALVLLAQSIVRVLAAGISVDLLQSQPAMLVDPLTPGVLALALLMYASRALQDEALLDVLALLLPAAGAALLVFFGWPAGRWLATGAVAVAALSHLLALWVRPSQRLPGIADFYRNAIAEQKIRPDPAQQLVVDHLQQLADQHARFMTSQRMPWGWLRRPPKGLYLWGPVGRGKSFLMDGFYDVLPTLAKRRYHFHELVADVRHALHERSGVRNPLRDIVPVLVPPGGVIFIDELQIHDVDNGQLFAGLLREFRRQRNLVCLTSNQPPVALLGSDQASRERFAEAGALLAKQFEVIGLDQGEDYRELKLTGHDLYQTPIDTRSATRMADLFERLSGETPRASSLTLRKQELRCEGQHPSVLWVDFNDLCRQPRSYVDYLELVRSYATVMVSNVPQFAANDEDAARRFAWLVELLYDNRRRLVVSAAVPAWDLFDERLSSFGEDSDFGKIASRLAEMQSTEYDYVLVASQ